MRHYVLIKSAIRTSLYLQRYKTRLIHDSGYKTREMARADVFDYIKMFYNQIRHHSYLDRKSPEAFEAASK
ncbi:IS3 family transposase [uncultured Acinetobacter sp.]|uniref:IS3 family transposase n=1 Tax=uncultured Acinetobacter sp. TaxID=165433 RepID=UPI0026047699|nr:IS3 family transposase [uncultured Acinetobacter sp.]